MNIGITPRNSIFAIDSIDIEAPTNYGFSCPFCILKRPLGENFLGPSTGLDGRAYLLKDGRVPTEVMSVGNNCIWLGTIKFSVEVLHALNLFRH